MNKGEFIRELEPYLQSMHLESATPQIARLVDILRDVGFINYRTEDIRKVMQFIPRWLAQKSDNSEGRLLEGSLTPQAFLASESLAELLKPEIKAIRKFAFGSEGPPFGNLAEAEKWLDGLDNGLSKRLGLMEVMGYREEELPELSEEAEMWYEVVKKVSRLSDRIGISPRSLEYYILADIKPLTMPYEVRMIGKEYCKGRRKCWYVDIRINVELSFKDLIEIHNTVKEALGVKRGKRLNKKHVELYQLVKDRGGAVKGKDSVAFWKSVEDEWNSRHKEGDCYSTWKGVKLAYDRLYRKLVRWYPIEEVREDETEIFEATS